MGEGWGCRDLGVLRPEGKGDEPAGTGGHQGVLEGAGTEKAPPQPLLLHNSVPQQSNPALHPGHPSWMCSLQAWHPFFSFTEIPPRAGQWVIETTLNELEQVQFSAATAGFAWACVRRRGLYKTHQVLVEAARRSEHQVWNEKYSPKASPGSSCGDPLLHSKP
jgi:hypothetical protein